MPTGNDYFTALGALLRDIGSGTPRMVVDLDRLDDNLGRLLEMHSPESLRFVAKSLPSPQLLQYLSKRTGQQRLMVFHLPFLLQIVAAFPRANVLMGKPMPIAAMRRFYADRVANEFEDTGQLQWLADTKLRLMQFIELARAIGRPVSVSIEIDVGMHRGGLADEDSLAEMLDTIRGHREELRLAGFMGYDAHVPKAPWPHSVAAAAERAKERYGEFLEFAWANYPELEEGEWCVNGAGSPTIAMHGEESPLNDYSLGSALVKPTSFDLPTLQDFEPAAWIAAPVLKRLAGVRIPFIERLPSGGRDTLFIYGGKWMAEPCYPDGLRESPIYGLSSNQQMLTVPSDSDVAVDDYIFLRPMQSEAVMLQFGDLCVVRGNRHIDDWPVFQNAGFPVERIR
ncbi:MAG: alanine racemase [Woeseiaceae bacterium]|nr:alanine racemase [Woeseiaceae bacterium]